MVNALQKSCHFQEARNIKGQLVWIGLPSIGQCCVIELPCSLKNSIICLVSCPRIQAKRHSKWWSTLGILTLHLSVPLIYHQIQDFYINEKH